MVSQRDVLFCAPVRTAIGMFNGSLKDTPAVDLGSAVVRATLARAGLPGESVGTVVMGNVIQAGNGMNPARQAALNGGLPVSVPALTVNRVCGSGAQAIVSAAREVLLGEVDAAVAGGMENMDRAPYLLAGGRWGYRMGNAEIHDSMLRDGLVDAFSGEHSGWHTEDLVGQEHISREDQDRWAERSQQRFGKASAEGRFAAEIVPVDVRTDKTSKSFAVDEAPRLDTTYATLEKLRPAFRPDGSITAGNAPGLNSGAAAMLVTSQAFAEARGLSPVARLKAWGIAGVTPGMFGLGPVPAIQLALQRAGWAPGDVERVEINEAFAAVPLAVLRHLGLPEDIVNVEGGAIAHGHPIGATGAVLVTRLIHSMRRDGVRRGIVSLCIGGGQGIALAIECS